MLKIAHSAWTTECSRTKLCGLQPIGGICRRTRCSRSAPRSTQSCLREWQGYGGCFLSQTASSRVHPPRCSVKKGKKHPATQPWLCGGWPRLSQFSAEHNPCLQKRILFEYKWLVTLTPRCKANMRFGPTKPNFEFSGVALIEPLREDR